MPHILACKENQTAIAAQKTRLGYCPSFLKRIDAPTLKDAETFTGTYLATSMGTSMSSLNQQLKFHIVPKKRKIYVPSSFGKFLLPERLMQANQNSVGDDSTSAYGSHGKLKSSMSSGKCAERCSFFPTCRASYGGASQRSENLESASEWLSP